MLYQTLPLFFHLNPCSTCCSPPPSPPHNTKNFLSVSSSSELKMDCVETKALKASFWPEMSFNKQTPQQQQQQQVVVSEDLWCGNGANDDLFVEGLLDFSNEEDIQLKQEHQDEEEEEEEEKGSSCVSSLDQNPNSSSSLLQDELGCVPDSELSVPADDVDIADLEWLSHFVEESEISLQHQQQQHVVVEKVEEEEEFETPCRTGFEPCMETQTPPVFIPVSGFSTSSSSVPGAKARSKRSRTGGRAWSLGSLLPMTESSSSSSSSYSSSPSSSSSSSYLFFNHSSGLDFFGYMRKPPPAKKLKRRAMTMTETQQQQQQQQRRCSHCGVQKTPQWRTGPLGAKTLCNACGVRYKSGRLLPEYRPACSPTFSSEVHSNNHRKVLEMRRKKEVVFQPESELTQPLHGFC